MKLLLSTTEDGTPLAVMRPSDPARAIARALEAQRTQNQALIALAFTEQPHTFVGYLAIDGTTPRVVDPGGEVIGDVQAGDTFIADPEGGKPIQ